tara:strand:+ start:176 stop:430 length:255 start_codon:yes stop_codon:yes gene_type:complete
MALAPLLVLNRLNGKIRLTPDESTHQLILRIENLVRRSVEINLSFPQINYPLAHPAGATHVMRDNYGRNLIVVPDSHHQLVNTI